MFRKIFREIKQIWYGYGVPFVVTPDKKLKCIVDVIELKDGESFVDVGCGDGRILDALEAKYPGANIRGYESSYYPYSLALQRKERSGGKYEIFHKDIFTVSLQDVDHIFIYMVPYMVQKLTKKIHTECKMGTKIYIQSHEINGRTAEKVVPLSEKNNLYIYTL